MSIDGLTFRKAVGNFVTGVAVVATDIGSGIQAMTVSSFASLSLDPPLILFCAGKSTKTGQGAHFLETFSANILRHDQEPLSTYFAGAWPSPTVPPFRFVPLAGVPMLEGCAVCLSCTKEAVHEGGDHWIVVGRVLTLHFGIEPRHPLAFFAGRYASLEKENAPAPDLRRATSPILAFYDTWDR